MNFDLDKVALVLMLPEAVLLSTFPFIFYRIARGGATKSGCLPTLWLGIGLIVMALYALIYLFMDFASGMSNGNTSSSLENRLLQHPLQVALSLTLFPTAAVWLAVREKGTLGLWVFATGTLFLSYWAGQGWLLAEMDWGFTLAVVAAGGLCGLTAGVILSRSSQPRERFRQVLLWSGVGVIFAAAGGVARWFAPTPLLRRIRIPVSVDPTVLVSSLVLVAFVWLSLSTVAAIRTGYLTPSSRKHIGRNR